MRICIAICTAGRPKSLSVCLASVMPQAAPDGADVRIVVVDNNAEANAAATVESFAGRSPFPIEHVHEPEPGIPFARNRALDAALARASDWIVFIDDDEEVEPGWLTGLFEAAAEHDADVVQGYLQKLYPPRLPAFVVAKQHPRRAEGEVRPVAWTHNVAFRASLVDPAQGGLRFDEQMRFTGGTDAVFFRQAAARGAKIVATQKSVATERQPAERLTLRWQLAREKRTGAGDVEALRRAGQLTPKRSGKERSRARQRLVTGSLGLVAGTLHIFRGWTAFHQKTGESLLMIARTTGTLQGLRQATLAEPYRKIDGQ